MTPPFDAPRESGTRRFVVALSFPGERRAFVAAVAECLAAKLGRERIFYDQFFEAELARPNLDVYLQNIYRNESDLVVPFFCEEYERKEWCGLELRALRDLLKARRDADIMPIRFDDVELPGQLAIDGYVDVGSRGANAIAELILARVAAQRPRKPPPVLLLRVGETQRLLHLGETLIIGREPPSDSDIRIEDDTRVSREHARVSFTEAGVFIEDLGAKNCTYLNDVEISHVAARPGDRIRCGRSVVEIIDPAATETVTER
jgi:FHA domain/TIR domain